MLYTDLNHLICLFGVLVVLLDQGPLVLIAVHACVYGLKEVS